MIIFKSRLGAQIVIDITGQIGLMKYWNSPVYRYKPHQLYNNVVSEPAIIKAFLQNHINFDYCNSSDDVARNYVSI